MGRPGRKCLPLTEAKKITRNRWVFAGGSLREHLKNHAASGELLEEHRGNLQNFRESARNFTRTKCTAEGCDYARKFSKLLLALFKLQEELVR